MTNVYVVLSISSYGCLSVVPSSAIAIGDVFTSHCATRHCLTAYCHKLPHLKRAGQGPKLIKTVRVMCGAAASVMGGTYVELTLKRGDTSSGIVSC